MITEDYVSFETAKLLKEKGFNERCNRVYQGPNLKYTTLPISPLMSLGELGGFHPKPHAEACLTPFSEKYGNFR
jgi:hypothetical protein